MGFTTGKINVGDIFKKTLDAALGILGQAVIQEGSKIPAVQREVEAQKVVAGKNILWKYFPYAILAVMGVFMISKVR